MLVPSALRLPRASKSLDRKMDFVVLSAYRSGSTYFAGALDSHPDVICHDELFNAERSIFSSRFARDPSLELLPQWVRVRHCRAFLGQVLARQGPAARTGFKMLLNTSVPQTAQLRGPLTRLLLEDRALSKIILLRKNALRRHLSLKIAQQHKKWHVMTQNREIRPVALDVEEFFQMDKRVRARYAALITMFRKGKHPFILLNYEDFTGPGRELAFEKAQKFLQVRRADLASPYRRMNPFPLSMMIVNYAEAERRLKPTRYARFFREPA